MHAIAEGCSVKLFDINRQAGVIVVSVEQRAKANAEDIDWTTLYESGDDVQSLELSFNTPTRLLWSKYGSDNELIGSTAYVCLWSEWKLILFDEIKDAIRARNSTSAYYCCASNIGRLSRLGWSVPASLNPDMTRVVTGQQAGFRQAFLMSMPHASLAGEGLIKTFVEYANRKAPLSAKEVLCLPLTLSDRDYLFYSNYTASSFGLATPPRTPPSNTNSTTLSTGVIMDDLAFDAIYYQIDCDAIRYGLDARTTCMLRNIPNKYTQVRVLSFTNASSNQTPPCVDDGHCDAERKPLARLRLCLPANGL